MLDLLAQSAGLISVPWILVEVELNCCQTTERCGSQDEVVTSCAVCFTSHDVVFVVESSLGAMSPSKT
jgi:hypothetical protein